TDAVGFDYCTGSRVASAHRDEYLRAFPLRTTARSVSRICLSRIVRREAAIRLMPGLWPRLVRWSKNGGGTRPHSSLGNRPPSEFAQALNIQLRLEEMAS